MTAYLPTYKEAGTGPLLLFLHGLGGNRHSFDLQFEVLAGSFRCVAWDTPGYGGSDPIDEMTFETHAACVTNLINHLADTPYAVIGHSMGGMIAQTWLRRGGRCEKLVLAQTSATFGKPGSEWNEKFLAGRLKPLDEGKTPADFARPLIESMFHDRSLTDAIELGVATMSPLPSSVYRQAINCLVTFDETAYLPRIPVPVLCLAAENDTTAPPATLQKMTEAIPTAEYVCLPNAGHLAYIETPGAFANAIQNFLD